MASDADKIQNDWFENVENFRPLRGGRKADTLNQVASGMKKTTNLEAEKKFKECFAASECNIEDPLSEMCKFVLWFEEHFPSGNYRTFYPMLYKICTTFCIMPQYRNDERILKLWLKLAASFPESGFAMMEFAFTKGSCRELAKFYIRWSEMYEFVYCWNRAREKLLLGLRMHAMPLTDLHNARDELETKIMCHTRKHAHDSDTDMDEEETNSDFMGNRETLSKLRGLGRKHHAPVFRIPQGSPGKVKQFETLPNSQNTFEVFVEDNTIINNLNVGDPLEHNNLIDELKNDPDYQALFGFFDYREKVDLHFSNKENLSKSGRPIENCKIKNKRPVEVVYEFEVFSDKIVENKPIKEKPKLRLRLQLGKKLVNEMSLEEAYALRLYPA